MTIQVKDANGTTRTIATNDDLIPIIEGIGSVNDLIAPIEGIGSVNDLIAPIEAIGSVNSLVAPIEAIGKVDDLIAPIEAIGKVDDLIAPIEAIGSVNSLVAPIEAIGSVSSLIAPIEEIGKVDDLIPPINVIGTRTYNYAGIQRVAVSVAAADSSAITATEVMVYASTKCYILPGASGTATSSNAIPIEAGEKFHFRITSGHKISVIRDSVDGYLHVVPVA